MDKLQYIAFDLEIAKELPDGADNWKDYRPLGITCAATVDDLGETRVWHGNYSPKMDAWEVEQLLQFLESAGKPVVTWNGLGFDFDVMAEETSFIASARAAAVQERVKALALSHIDVAFQMLCEKGFMCGLNSAAKGMGLSGKTEGMSGAKAPTMWAQGRKEQDQVLEYVAQDARTTAELYQAVLDKGFLQWITKRGGASLWVPTFRDGQMLTCQECLALPLPDVSWLSNPWPREKFAGWAL
jgi:hypothetical protein